MSDSIHLFDRNKSPISFTAKSAIKGIDFINSLDTETFVIEGEEDIQKVLEGANVKLANGNKDIVLHKTNYKEQSMIQFSENKHWGAVGIFILKGATVTQKRGEV
ncbi:hypothetical protein MMG00_12645 [Ignatzschineria rhizosphaerae]|uniref:Uncharacterized protein n=1 Tax=Ignatzschineria rhizosphaerae TaxID=2923279 RepID=A0ABY3X5H2_9GAMM|nr:hypothetical protein [Ignatzschineria rhizosphaerae]UNM96030.1 hypothetical protein MMG00_12645 [Ignatzschineria rhizosphaerae]